VTRWPLTRSGLYLDREFAVVDVSSGKVLTQKTHPVLSCVRTEIRLSGFTETDGSVTDDVLIMKAPSSYQIADLIIPLNSDRGNDAGNDSNLASFSPECGSTDIAGTVCSVSVCGDRRWATEVSTDANRWFSSVLQTQCIFVRRLPEDQETSAESRSRGPRDASKAAPSPSPFVNDAQFLLISIESVEALKQVAVL
jgi:uncharacterized protein YcbX